MTFIPPQFFSNTVRTAESAKLEFADCVEALVSGWCGQKYKYNARVPIILLEIILPMPRNNFSCACCVFSG